MRGLQLIQPGSLAKKSALVTSVVKNASCSRGWLKITVQIIFATVTVTSFILIVLMATPKWPPTGTIDRQSRCSINVCRVVCRETPFYAEYEEDITNTLSEVDEHCQSIFLTLNKPMFLKNTMPKNWLSILRKNIHELTIIGGNLMHVPADAFVSQYSASIRVLEFKSLVLKAWSADSLVGLSSLRRFYVTDSVILNVPRDALRPVASTLGSLAITKSNHWDPTNVTGSIKFSRLRSVDFSSNSFKGVLGPTSFTGLERCKVLYLNSCGITSIGAGAFDSLRSIETLYLQNNHLVTLSTGLFKNVMKIVFPKPRINLQDNMWHCDCLEEEIRELTKKKMLLTDPVCDSPDFFKYKTFRDLETSCSQKSHSIGYNVSEKSTTADPKWWNQWDDIYGFIYVIDKCFHGKEPSENKTLRMLSPVQGHRCPIIQEYHYISILPSFTNIRFNQIMPKKNWIKLTYFLKTLNYSMVEIGALEADGYGLVWYQTSCPNEVYCVSDIPDVFRIYSLDVQAQYVFCPILLSTGEIDRDSCVIYQNVTFDYEDAYNRLHIFLYVGVGILCVMIGALFVYGLIRKHPNLLKGSKRILFVKHKSVDALVLPPKVPLRNDLMANCKEKNIFMTTSHHIVPNRFNRNVSSRSSRSSAPSYISALVPTEEQLAEWRIRHHFNNDLSITSKASELSTYSWVSNEDGLYYSIDADNYRIYESLK